MSEPTVLVANRGEIAVRVIRCCRELGLRAAAVHSDADADSLHVRLADEAHRIGPAPAAASYLDVDAVLGAGKAAGASLVHPGYGLLSESVAFAEAVAAAGLTFVGPTAEVIARMGDKVAARGIAEKCGIPVPPGTGEITPEQATAEAERVGFPLVVKASFGGGGRGMRVVADPAELLEAIAAAKREARAAFGRSEVHLERYLRPARHVEVQVLADTRGTVVHLGDRDCTVQRRHQKLIEEAPAFGLGDSLRTSLREAAVTLAREVGYIGAGTVEFLVLPETEEFFFLEMNTRLQVEHGVTELVSGVDIVAAQLRVALGEPLGFTQDEVDARGHAIQARIAAEEPGADFQPMPGTISQLCVPLGPGIRNDFGVQAGDEVSRMYDSLFGKVLAYGGDRDHARRRLVAALGELRVVGVPSTAGYLRTILESASFTAGSHDTGSVEREWTPEPASPEDVPPKGTVPEPPAPRDRSTVETVPTRRVHVQTSRGPVELVVPGRAARPGTTAADGGRPSRVSATHPGATNAVSTGVARAVPPRAPMDATVVSVPITSGQTIAVGDVVAVLEAMKMEMPVRTEVAGTVTEVLVAPGTPVTAGTPLLSLE